MRNIKVVLLFCITYFMYYLARYNYPLALPFIKEEFSLSSIEIGLIASVLTLGYAFGQLINGVLVDRRGPKLLMSIGGMGIVVANTIMGVSHFYSLLVIGWMLNGYFQAMGYPSTLKLIVNWFKENERGKPLGWSEFFQSIASILILPLGGFLAYQFGWRFVFLVPAVLMGVTTIWYYLTVENNPPNIKDAEPENSLWEDMKVRYKLALMDWRLVSANFSYGFSQFVRYAVITWVPLYLFSVTGLTIFKAALAGMAFQLGGAIGSLLIGWMADLPVFVNRRWGLIVVGMIISGLAGIGLGQIAPTEVSLIVTALFVCGVGIEALEVAYFLTPTDYLGESMTATGVGCMNATGKFVASLQGVVLGGIIDKFGYGSAFGLMGGFAFLAALFILPLMKGKNVSTCVPELS